MQVAKIDTFFFKKVLWMIKKGKLKFMQHKCSKSIKVCISGHIPKYDTLGEGISVFVQVRKQIF